MLALCAVGVLLPFWPGLIHADSNITIWETTTNVYEDWWSPFLTVVWDGLLGLGFGVGAIFLVQVLILIGGLYLSLRVALRRVPAALATCAICAFPPVYGQAATISRDTYYIGLTLLSFGLIAVAVRARGRHRALGVAGSMLAALLAFLCRQNALGYIFVLVGLIALLMTRDSTWRPRRLEWLGRVGSRPLQILIAGATAAAASLVVLGGASFVYARAGVLEIHPERPLLIYDLAAISTATDRNAFPPDISQLPSNCCVTPADVSLATLEERFDYTNVITLWPDGNPLTGDFRNEQLAAAEARLLRDAWWDAVTDHPDAYLIGRVRLLGSQLGITRPPMDAYVAMSSPTNYDRPLEFGGGYEAATEYITTFVGPHSVVPIDRAWLYLLIASGSLVLVLRRLRPIAVPSVAMVAALWVNVATLALVSMGAGFRYVALLIPVALILAAFVLASYGRLRFLVRPHLTSGVEAVEC